MRMTASRSNSAHLPAHPRHGHRPKGQQHEVDGQDVHDLAHPRFAVEGAGCPAVSHTIRARPHAETKVTVDAERIPDSVSSFS